MKTKQVISILILPGIGILFLSSCKKDPVSLGEINKPPIANAGPYQSIQLPRNNVILDASGSVDLDGTIINFQWTLIAGSGSFNIVNALLAKTVVENLDAGTYRFELKVTDNGSISAKDTVQIRVIAIGSANHQPVVNAGLDQTIILPINTVTLDGSSSDLDNDITNYLWTKISGPSSFNIENSNSIRTQVNNLNQGNYQLELKVTDALGLFSKDTMLVIVIPAMIANSCEDNRPQIAARLVPVKGLSQLRPFMTTAAAGNKIVFAGGSLWPANPYASSRVDIYDIITQTWSTAELSTPRWQIATVAAGNKIFFAVGGYYDDGDNAVSLSTVDIYDVSTNTWSVNLLSEPRFDIAAATVGNKVFFAGEIRDYGISDKVDIYDLSTNSWSTSQLSEARGRMSSVTANNKIYFAGGQSAISPINNGNTVQFVASDKIDIYDNTTDSWSISHLTESRYFLTSISVFNKIYWAGGLKTNRGNINNQVLSCTVEIKDVNTQNTTIDYLVKPRDFFIDGGQNAVVKDNKIIFFTGRRYFISSNDNTFDIYDITTNTWSIGVLPVTILGASIISVNNIIYIAGGLINGDLSIQVYKLEF